MGILGRAALVVALAVGIGACQEGRRNLAGGSPAGKPIAFESIEGAPPAIRTAFASELASAASSRQVDLVGSGEARYRVRGYVTAEPGEGGTTLAYVWDVFDVAEKRRAQRLTGVSPMAVAAADPWSTLDRDALARVAAQSMDDIAAFLAASSAPAAPVATASAVSSEAPDAALGFAAR